MTDDKAGLGLIDRSQVVSDDDVPPFAANAFKPRLSAPVPIGPCQGREAPCSSMFARSSRLTTGPSST